jgi:hypothetical protein
MIKIGFSTSRRNPISAVIRWITGSRVSHVWLLDTDGLYGVPMVIEASIEGFRPIPYNLFERDNVIIFAAEPSPPIDLVMPEVMKMLSTPYDTTGLFFAGVAAFLNRFKIWSRSPIHTSTALFCSEAIVRILQKARYPGARELDPDTTTPGRLLAFFGGES